MTFNLKNDEFIRQRKAADDKYMLKLRAHAAKMISYSNWWLVFSLLVFINVPVILFTTISVLAEGVTDNYIAVLFTASLLILTISVYFKSETVYNPKGNAK